MDPFEPGEEKVASGMTQAQQRLQQFAKYAAIYHLAMVPIIIFFGNWLIKITDKLGDWFGMQVIDTGKNDFWMVPIIGLFITLALSSYRVWRNVTKIDWLQPLLFAHGITGLSFLVYYFIDVKSLAYLGGSFLELALFAVTAYFWLANREP